MICAVPLTGTVPISKVLAPRFTVGMEDRGDVVVTCPVGLVLLVLLALLLPRLVNYNIIGNAISRHTRNRNYNT